MNFHFGGEFYKLESENEFLIYGPASVEVLDSQGDIIKIDAIREALPKLLKRARLTVDHKDQIVGEIIESYTKADSTYKTEVRKPTPDELNKFSQLTDDKEALFVLGRIWNDTRYCGEIRNAIMSGKYKSYSISGNVVEARPCTKDEFCDRLVSKLDLSAVTICQKGANPAAQFDILKEGNTMTEEVKETPQEAPAPEFVLKSDFEVYKAELETKLSVLSKIAELEELIKKKEEKPIEVPKAEPKEEPKKEEGIKIDVEKIKEELKKELLSEFKPVQKSKELNEQKKAPDHRDIMKLF